MLERAISALPVEIRESQAARSVQALLDSPDLNTELTRIYQDYYQSQEVLEKGRFLWELLGKRAAEYEARMHAKKTGRRVAEIKREAYVQGHTLAAAAELARRKAQANDAILEEQLQRWVEMLADVLNQANQVLSRPQYSALPTEAKEELLMRLYERAEERVFSPQREMLAQHSVEARSDEGPLIIDADEF